MTDTLLDEETEAIIAWLEGPPEMLAALRFRIRRLMDDARDDELEVEALRSNPPDAPDTGLTEALDVRWMDHQGTETEWYFVVMEPMSRGIMRRGYGCRIKKSIAYDQSAVKIAASREEADYVAMVWAKNMAREMAIKSFAESDTKHIPPSDSGELERALDRYFQAVVAYHRWREPDIEDSQARAIEMAAARGAVADLFERLQKENADRAEVLTELTEDLRVVSEDNERLRSTALTRDEIDFLYGIPIAPGCTPDCQVELDRICEKLRSLSSLRSSSLGEQK